MSLRSPLEAALFVAGKPLATKKVSQLLGVSLEQANLELESLAAELSAAGSGLQLAHNEDEWQLVTAPENEKLCATLVKSEFFGELTKPQLEALTVIAYAGPLTKPELEQLRGVNCSLIIRNLMVRGLIGELQEVSELLPQYQVTLEFLRVLGVARVADLPDYAELSNHQYITAALAVPPDATSSATN